MRLFIPGLCFLKSSVPLRFDTDGHVTLFEPMSGNPGDSANVLVLTEIHVQMFDLRSVHGVSLFDTIMIPDDFKIPEIYDGTQDLGGKSILILMLNGWGDMIHIQPALRALYEETASSGDLPRITLGCNWIDNFPYPGVPYIHEVRPNILTLKDLSEFELLINLTLVNRQRSLHKSMKHLCLEIMRLNGKDQETSGPSIGPDSDRVARIQPILQQIREETGKKLLCVNWKSRFPHKNTSPVLFSKIISKLGDRYQALLFKDVEISKVMQKEIEDLKVPIMNLSYLIHDYHDTVAALSLVDVFISVDTGIVHAAGAMGIPGVALFGPFPSETHVADYRSIIGIRAQYEGKTCKGPCLETHRGCSEVDFSSTKASPCFEVIRADYVIDALEKAVNPPKVLGSHQKSPVQRLSS